MRKGHGEAPKPYKRSTPRGVWGTSAKDAWQKSSREDDDRDGDTTRSSRITDAPRHGSGRKRKPSLRQGILGMSMLRRDPHHDQPTSTTKPPTVQATMAATAAEEEEETTPRPFSYANASLASSSDNGWTPTAAPSFSTPTTSTSYRDPDQQPPGVLASPATSPRVPYASTTDDEEATSFYRPSASGSSAYNTRQLQAAGSAMALPRRRPNPMAQRTSLAVVQSPPDFALEEEWDYSETRWWGWIILIVTWIVFVVVMGSCLGVWSWAWDVGETPYAPPELEDDPTLPITGYYPALMVCTAVMAWVWVVVAWVGMKYFRHAKMVGDDG